MTTLSVCVRSGLMDSNPDFSIKRPQALSAPRSLSRRKLLFEQGTLKSAWNRLRPRDKRRRMETENPATGHNIHTTNGLGLGARHCQPTQPFLYPWVRTRSSQSDIRSAMRLVSRSASVASVLRSAQRYQDRSGGCRFLITISDRRSGGNALPV